MMKIDLCCLGRVTSNKGRGEIKKTVARILKKEKIDGRINVIIGDDKLIRRLNRDYRKKDKTTDVLSFEINENGLLGEIYISLPVAKRQAKEYGVTLVDELVRLAEHGTLHILGYTHKEMKC
jgi:probable rRNA maturation factor